MSATTFALAYTAWRRAQGFKHADLAARLGISRRTSEAYAQGQRLPEPDVMATLRRMGLNAPLPPRRGPGRPEVTL